MDGERFMYATPEAQLPIYWVPVLGSLYKLILSITQEPSIWVPGLLGLGVSHGVVSLRVQVPNK